MNLGIMLDENFAPDFSNDSDGQSPEREGKQQQVGSARSETEHELEPEAKSPSDGSDDSRADQVQKNKLRELGKLLTIRRKSRDKVKRPSKRRYSSSSSKSSSHSVSDSKRSNRGRDYVAPSKVAKIFNNSITPESLCELSEMDDGTPADVRRVMPAATVAQICEMCDL